MDAEMPVVNLPKAPKFSKERIMVLVIVILILLLVVAFAYIQVQNSFNAKNKTGAPEKIVETGETVTATSTAIEVENSKEIFAGASPVTVDNQVLDNNFELAQNSAIPNSPEAPKSTVIKQEDLPAEVLNLKIGNNKISPDSFTVKAGDLISLAVTSDDNQVHVFGFYDGAVGAIAMGVSEGQTKVMNFNAPAPGEYEFGCGVPQHRANGETGKMIVK